jgi:LPXTG-motif cell wall-anchored protein
MNPKSRTSRRWARCCLAATLAMTLALAAEPAEACGCGIVLPHEGSIDVTQERAIIRWDGQTEDIIMALQVQGDAKEAAWIMPVPSPAQVKLGDPKMFDFLQEFTKPRIETITVIGDAAPAAQAPAAAPPVTLLDRREIGLYDVSTLAATNATALTDWLNVNGYKFPEAAAKVLQPYVDQGWYYIAARISPSKTSEVKGELDPLWMTFKSNRVVYPMRPTALARGQVGVSLYILADHRMDVTGLHTNFAGWISPTDLPTEEHPLQQVVDRKYFLTKLQTVLGNPAKQVTDDYFANQVPDVEYRDVEYVHRYVSPTASPAVTSFPFGIVLAGLVLIAAIAGIVIRKRRKSITPR